MTANYVLLEKITVGAAGASSVTFSGIPQTGYTDLVVKYTARSTYTTFPGDAIDVRLTFNGSSSGYSERMLYGTGSAAASAATSGSFLNWAGTQTNTAQTANTFSSSEIYIPNYTSSNNKSMSIDAVQENNATASAARLVASLWANSAAITSLTLSPDYGNFAQYSTFYLYGVAKLGTTPAIVPYATGGDTIMTDGTYWYHAFKSSGTFTPAKGLSCDVLVVAGGGGGGHGGGGAGGLYYSSSNSVATAQTVTVGAGGAGASAAHNARGSNGSNSVFGSLTAAVGGGGGGQGAVGIETGNSGGSGGGGAPRSAGPYAGGAGTSGQGNTGGTSGAASGFYAAGGGGGAGAVGDTGNSATGTGAGGSGSSTYSSWGSVTGTGQNVSGTYYFAGGGGGGSDNSAGTGGNGGGGAGKQFTGSDGIANTGGGGGGSGNTGGGAGGSGLVIVRYLI